MPFNKKIRNTDDASESVKANENGAAEKKNGKGVSIVKRPDGPVKQGTEGN